jgi:serine/threonine protein phosphatase PrpC
MTMKVSSAGATDTGRIRKNNEDSLLVLENAGLFAVADGVGGRKGGEVASSIAVQTLKETIPDLLGGKDRTPPAGVARDDNQASLALRKAISLSNRLVREAAERTPELAGMGSTVTSLLLTKGGALIAHVGDSRAYLLRQGTLQQLTNDHSFVAEQVKAGVITPEQARLSAYRHVITRALGVQADVAPDLREVELKPGDRFLLCSDGLTEMIADKEIADILDDRPPEEAVKRLINAANEAGGVDNITAIVIDVSDI